MVSLLPINTLLSKVCPPFSLFLRKIALFPGVFSPQTACNILSDEDISGLTDPAGSLLKLVSPPKVPLSPEATIENTSRLPSFPL